MAPWILSVCLAMASFTIHAVAVKYLGERFPSSFITASFYTAAVLLLYVIFFIEKPAVDYQQALTLPVILPLILAGITIGLTDFFFVRSLGQGAPLSLAIPVLLGGSTILITMLSIPLFKEAMTVWKALGACMTVLGIYLMYRK